MNRLPHVLVAVTVIGGALLGTPAIADGAGETVPRPSRFRFELRAGDVVGASVLGGAHRGPHRVEDTVNRTAFGLSGFRARA